MIRRFLDRLLPDELFAGIGRINWRLVDEPSRPNPTVVTVSGGLCAPTSGAWDPLRAGAPSNWRSWPDVRSLLPVFSAPRGGIRFDLPTPMRNDVIRTRRRGNVVELDCLECTLDGHSYGPGCALFRTGIR